MKCFFCEEIIFSPPALLFGAPEFDEINLDLNVKKMYVCKDCYNFLTEFKPTKKTWRNQYESP